MSDNQEQRKADLEVQVQSRPTPEKLIAEIANQEIQEFQDRLRRESQSTADDEKIDYTNFLRGKPWEMDLATVESMRNAALEALAKRGLRGAHLVKCDCYADGRVRLEVNGNYYGVFDCAAGEFFSGCAGD